MKKNSTMNYLTQNIRNNNISLKNRPLLNKEINSLSISKRSEKASENFFLLQNSSQEKDHLSEQRVIGSLSNSSFKQHLQMKALKSLIKTKYGSIPQNFLTILRNIDKKDDPKLKKQLLENNHIKSVNLLDFFSKNLTIPEKKALMQKNTKTANIFSKMTNVNKSYDYTKKQKFVDLEKAKARLAQTSTQRFGVENLQSCKNNLHYESDVRPRESEGKKEQDSNQRNLLPDSDLEEILDKFIMMEKIINYKGFMQSMRFILKEIKGRFPKSGAFLEKVETCYEKLINFLLILVENSENHEKKEKEEEKNQNNLKKNKNLSEKASQTQREEEPWREKLEQLIIDNHNMEKQNNRMILIIENLNKRGIDIEKLFEKQMDSLLNPNHRLSFMEIKKLHMDSEDSNVANLNLKDNYYDIGEESDEGNMLEQRGIVGMDLELQKPKIINKKLADTLKLDLRKVNNLNLNGNGIVKNEEIVGFHQEFMSKINEFSESWRNAALNEH